MLPMTVPVAALRSTLSPRVPAVDSTPKPRRARRRSSSCGFVLLRYNDKLVAAADGTSPEATRYADAELMLKILYPPIILFYRYLRQDHEEFNKALAEALQWHKEYWTATEDRAISAEGLVALGPLAIACLARDAGFPLDIESEYLPKALLEYAWGSEIDT
jgi:hypothetical protein